MTAAPGTAAALQRAVEDTVRALIDGWTPLQRLVAYRYLWSQGYRIASVPAEMAKALREATRPLP